MREVKFRAWYEKEKRFLSWDELQDGTESLQTYFNNELSDVSPLMQYTGLKDKNGKEIYEGDILHCIFEDENYIVEWDEIGAGFLFNRINNKKRTGGIDYYEFEDICGSFGFEVIGNIYEHPHLLEEQHG